jgi:hypothetical protein
MAAVIEVPELDKPPHKRHRKKPKHTLIMSAQVVYSYASTQEGREYTAKILK